MSRKQKQPYFRFFASDWLGGTRGMKAAEVGVYITLIAMMYERCEPVPEDHKRLSRQCGCSVLMLGSIIEMLVDDGKLTRTDAGIWNKRVEKEFKWREKKSEQSTEAANVKWENANKNKGGDMRTQCKRNADGMPNQKPETRNQKEENTKRNLIKDEFPTWYDQCPRKVGKAAAEKSYLAARKKTDAATLLAGIRRYADEVRGKDQKYIAHPATWLNQERWTDGEGVGPPTLFEQRTADMRAKFGEGYIPPAFGDDP